MRIKCIIIEDEPLAQDRLLFFIKKLAILEVVQCFDNAIDAISFLKNNRIDLVFLDIQMEGLTGIELLENTQLDAQVIITTAYDRYALKGYELNIVDYLLKPFSFNRFLKAIDKVQLKKPTSGHAHFVFIKTATRLEKVMIDDILYIEGMGEYRRIHTRKGQIMTLETFNDLEQSFAPEDICRVHKSYMVAINKIDSIERKRIKIGKKLIPISDTYHNAFIHLIKPKKR